MQEYDIAVVGDEPAGLWMLHEYARQMQPHGGPGPLVHFSLGADPHPMSIPSLLAKAFNLQVGEEWNIELVSPQENLLWHPDALKKRFPGLPDPQGAAVVKSKEAKATPELLTKCNGDWLREIRKAVSRHPDLFWYAQAVWKWMGRSHPTVSESQFLFAYRFHHFAYWDPKQMIPKDVDKMGIALSRQGIEGMRSLGKRGLEITFKEIGPVLAKRWIWNAPYRQIATLFRGFPSGLDRVCPGLENTCSSESLFGLRILCEGKACPVPMRPVTVYMEHACIPDPRTEMWPIQLFSFGETKELCLWAEGPSRRSLEATQAAFREALKRLYRLLPHLPTMTKSIAIGLDSDCSFSDATRQAWLDRLEESRIELYTHTWSLTDCPQSGFFLLAPAVGCHLPYPFGTLLAARDLVKQWVPKKLPAQKPPGTTRTTTRVS